MNMDSTTLQIVPENNHAAEGTTPLLLVVLVVYGESAEKSIALQSLADNPFAQTVAWLIWDNHPAPDAERQLGDWFVRRFSDGAVLWFYEPHPENPGLSVAYRSAAQRASGLGCQWLLLADQDTRFPPDWYQSYGLPENGPSDSAHEIKGVPSGAGPDGGRESIGLIVPQLYSGSVCISPAVHRLGISRPNPNPGTGELNLHRLMPINSGMLIRLTEYNRCGGHLPGVRVDFSDTAFVFRLRKSGVRAWAVPVVGQHGLSGIETATYSTRLQRFRVYCRDARAWAATEGPVVQLSLLALGRALVLTSRYGRIGFMRVLLQQFILGIPL